MDMWRERHCESWSDSPCTSLPSVCMLPAKVFKSKLKEMHPVVTVYENTRIPVQVDALLQTTVQTNHRTVNGPSLQVASLFLNV